MMSSRAVLGGVSHLKINRAGLMHSRCSGCVPGSCTSQVSLHSLHLVRVCIMQPWP